MLMDRNDFELKLAEYQLRTRFANITQVADDFDFVEEGDDQVSGGKKKKEPRCKLHLEHVPPVKN